METEAFLSGAWKSIEELEDMITLHELYDILDAMREKEMRLVEAIFASQGHDIRGEEKDDARVAVEERARKRLEEMKGAEQVRQSEFAELGALGIGFEMVGEDV